ncbi:MAG: NAD(P)-dependent oxidoreductase [Phaeodactylibacter sp.]|nr:NAD(P)-dependent oxidoreductase [Phaeodactylibacter sp.]
MKVLITGGAGYVGTGLVPVLLDKGYQVTVYDNLLFGGDPILPFFRRPNFDFIRGDVRDLDSLRKAAKDADVVIHLAAIVGYPACRKEPELAKAVNVGGTKNVIKATSDNQLIIFGSTGSNYGAVEEICTEETPLHPLSLYGQTKTLAERMLLQERNTIAWRFATAFGVSPRLRLDLMVNDFTYKSVTEGYLVIYEKHFMRTFIHVHDMARVFLFGIENRCQMVNNVYNVGSEKMNYSKEDICNLIKKHTGVYVHYADVGEDADKRNYVVSYDKINKLGYDTTITVEDGIRELIHAIRAIEFRKPYANV